MSAPVLTDDALLAALRRARPDDVQGGVPPSDAPPFDAMFALAVRRAHGRPGPMRNRQHFFALASAAAVCMLVIGVLLWQPPEAYAPQAPLADMLREEVLLAELTRNTHWHAPSDRWQRQLLPRPFTGLPDLAPWNYKVKTWPG